MSGEQHRIEGGSVSCRYCNHTFTFNFMRDMYSAEPSRGPSVGPVANPVDSRKEGERRSAAEEAERYINRQMEAVYGLDTAVIPFPDLLASLTAARAELDLA